MLFVEICLWTFRHVVAAAFVLGPDVVAVWNKLCIFGTVEIGMGMSRMTSTDDTGHAPKEWYAPYLGRQAAGSL